MGSPVPQYLLSTSAPTSLTSTDFHPPSTCKMGNSFKDDDMIVGDKRLGVRNTKKKEN